MAAQLRPGATKNASQQQTLNHYRVLTPTGPLPTSFGAGAKLPSMLQHRPRRIQPPPPRGAHAAGATIYPAQSWKNAAGIAHLLRIWSKTNDATSIANGQRDGQAGPVKNGAAPTDRG